MAHVDLSEVFEDNVGWGDISQEMQDIISTVPFWYPDDLEDPEKAGMKLVYDRGLKGTCMACAGKLGGETMLTIANAGLVMVHCGGACYTDQQVLGWLEEQYSDTVDQIKFRGGGADGDE